MSRRPLYIKDNSLIYFEDFRNALEIVGVSRGDTLFVHSDIGVFGKLPGPDRESYLPKTLVQVLTEGVGLEGDIILPTFTYSFCKNEVFDVAKTRSTVGALTEFFRKSENVIRSPQPIFSVACWGKNAEELADVSDDSFGTNSIFDKLYKKNGKILFFGAPFQSCTFVHYAEQSLGIPYRYMKKFSGIVRNQDKDIQKEINYYVRRLDMDTLTNFSPLEGSLEQKGILKRATVGGGEILCVNSKDLFFETQRMLKEDIFFLLKTRPQGPVGASL